MLGFGWLSTVGMAIGSDQFGYGKIHIQTRNFYPYPNPIRTRKIPENEYPNPIQWISDRVRVYPKPEIFVMDTQNRKPKTEIWKPKPENRNPKI